MSTRRLITLLIALSVLLSAPATARAETVQAELEVLASTSIAVGCGAAVDMGSVALGTNALPVSCGVDFGTSNGLAGAMLMASDESNSWALDSGANSIGDYNPATRRWDGAGSLFGVCTKGYVSASAGSVPAATGNCGDTDADPWFGLSATAVSIATTSGQATGRANLMFGAKVSSSQPKGVYSGDITFTAVANP